MKEWYVIDNVNVIDSPSIVLYREHLLHNLHKMLEMVDGDTSRLMPHLKTNKMPKVIQKMVDLGITKFKASTISEAEIAAREGAKHVLIAHQLVGPKITRFIGLSKHFPKTKFSTLIDNIGSVQLLEELAQSEELRIDVYIDINSGMNRSGIAIGSDTETLITLISKCQHIKFAGLHVYDGHMRNSDFKERFLQIESEFAPIKNFYEKLRLRHPNIELICGGTPSFTTHLKFKNRITSPGTCVFWDWGYGDTLKEQPFKPAALLVSRVISKPAKNIITIDLGHKAVGSENSIDKRVKFLNLKNYKLISQSEEHGVVEVNNWDKLKIGDVFYGIPYHICPTINLHDEVTVIENHEKIDTWEITARQRRLTF